MYKNQNQNKKAKEKKETNKILSGGLKTKEIF